MSEMELETKNETVKVDERAEERENKIEDQVSEEVIKRGKEAEDWVESGDLSKLIKVDTKKEEDSKLLFIGYGTFMTHSLRAVKEDSDMSETWGIPIKIIGTIVVEGYRRVCQPHSPYPYVVKEDGHSFMGLAFEIEKKHVKRMDGVEGVPYLYTRETVRIKTGKASMRKENDYFIYIPSKNTYEGQVKAMHRADMKDFWHERVLENMNKVAKRKYKELLGWIVKEIDKTE